MLQKQVYEEFMIRLYFGEGSDHLRLCIERAYLDLSRPLSGIGKTGISTQLRALAAIEIQRQLTQLQENLPATQLSFDSWHRDLCCKLQRIYAEKGYDKFFVGHGQKWINMTFKYVYTLRQLFLVAEDSLRVFDGIYSFCHVPLDSIIVAALKKYGFPSLNMAWSRMNDYEQYLSYQVWIRNRFPDAPLDIEFQLWSGKEIAQND